MIQICFSCLLQVIVVFYTTPMLQSSLPQKKIFEFAWQMNVFPIDIIATEGPITRMNQGSLGWLRREELTIEQYFVFYEFKHYIQHLCKEEFKEIVDYLEWATPKEKALIFAAIYIYEWTHRDCNYDMLSAVIRDMLPRQNTDEQITGEEWEQWNLLIHSYIKDRTVVFPAVEKEQNILALEYQNERNKAYKMLQDMKVLKEDDTIVKVLSGVGFESRMDELRKRMQPSEYKRFDALMDYLYRQYKRMMKSSGSPAFGNSSAKPKTLGNIATQILESRPNYTNYGAKGAL